MSKIKNGGLDQYGKVQRLNGIGSEGLIFTTKSRNCELIFRKSAMIIIMWWSVRPLRGSWAVEDHVVHCHEEHAFVPDLRLHLLPSLFHLCLSFRHHQPTWTFWSNITIYHGFVPTQQLIKQRNVITVVYFAQKYKYNDTRAWHNELEQ